MTDKTRILYVEGNTDGTIGGSYYSLLYLVDGVDKQRYEPTVMFWSRHILLPRFEATGARVVVRDSVKPVQLSAGEAAPMPVQRLLGYFQSAANFCKRFLFEGIAAASWLRRNRIDLVHFNNAIVRNHAWMLGAWLAGVKFITHERGINTEYSGTARFFARRIDAIVCISEAVRSSIEKGGLQVRYAPVIYNAIDPAKVVPQTAPGDIRKRHGLADDALIIGLVGNFKEWKGQRVVIRAMDRLKDRFPGLVCLLVGALPNAREEYLESLVRMTAEYGLEGRIVFTGFQSDVAGYMNAMDIVIHASILPEPFGRVVIEAMALSKPIVGARDGAIPEIVVDGVSGRMFTPGDDEELASVVAELLMQPERAQTLGEAGLARLKEKFDIVRNVRLTEHVYETILTGK